MTEDAGAPQDVGEPGVEGLQKALAQPVAKRKGRKKAAKPEASAPAPVPAADKTAASPVLPPSQQPDVLPEDAPVKALGTRDGEYFFLDRLGQVRRKKEGDLGRLHILSLFGGDEYLKKIWPVVEFDHNSGAWQARDKFNHDKLGPVLIKSCTLCGVWDPTNKVRGPGGWVEDDGSLVLHCGEKLFVSRGGLITDDTAGVHGDLLYPRRPKLPEPAFEDLATVGEEILDKLLSWNWTRHEMDARIFLGWLVAGLIGQAAPWRPMLYVNGSKGCGKSTLVTFCRWLFGEDAVIKPSYPTPAFIYQSLGDSSLPVLLDEFESKVDNTNAQKILEFMRVAATAGEIGRGGSENNPRRYNLKSCFAAFSIVAVPMQIQDASRMAILHLAALDGAPAPTDETKHAPSEYNLALGFRDRWARAGRRLRGKLLKEWPRYLDTYNAYFYALMAHGYDSRQAEQFGALGAASDIALYDRLDPSHVDEWVALFPPGQMDETKGYADEPDGCLQYLLASTVKNMFRGGTTETISYYLREGYRAKKNGLVTPNDRQDDANRVLAKLGIRLSPDHELKSQNADGRWEPVWWIEISNTHPALMELFTGTHWSGSAGARGGWAQALGAHEAADPTGIKRVRIDGARHWVTRLMWVGVFPPGTEDVDRGDEGED